MNVLVSDGNQRSALALTRALGKKGLSVTVGECTANSVSAKSKYCRRTIVYPSPAVKRELFQQAILEEVSTRPYQVFFPMTDLVITSILEMREKLARFVKVPLPHEKAYYTATDKSRLLQLAQKLNIPIPKTFFLKQFGRLKEIAKELSYPVVIKPTYSGMFSSNGWQSLGVEYAFSPEELLQKYDVVHRKIPFPLIQEKIEGTGYGIFLLVHDGEVKARFAHRRIREKPPSGGVSVLRESVSLESPMYDYAVELLRSLSWSGVAMVEFKIDAKDHTPKLMEINGRFWGSLQLAVDSGVNFPYLLYKVALGEGVSTTFNYKVGVKTRWLLGDLDHLLAIWSKGSKKLSLPDNHPGRWKSLFSFFKFYERNLKYEMLTRDDPRPGLWEIRAYTRNILKRVLGRSKGNERPKKEFLKGALHVHTTVSSDGTLSLDQLKVFLEKKGFDFAIITEHSRDVDPGMFSNLASECANRSDESFLFLPGLEFDRADGLHILGIGIEEFIDKTDPAKVIEEIHGKGGLAILAHPSKSNWEEVLKLKDELDGVEIWNVGTDGKFLPTLNSIKLYEKLRGSNPRLKAYLGVDLHTVGGFYDASLSLKHLALEKETILNALGNGNFENRSRFFKAGAFPKREIFLYLYLIIFGNLLKLAKTLRNWVKSE